MSEMTLDGRLGGDRTGLNRAELRILGGSLIRRPEQNVRPVMLAGDAATGALEVTRHRKRWLTRH